MTRPLECSPKLTRPLREWREVWVSVYLAKELEKMEAGRV